MTREKFRRALIKEEKLFQIAINIDKINHKGFVKLVTKNLLILVHARKKYAAFLDLNNHASIKDALMAHLKVESDKAKDIINKEYMPIAR